jgi:hypothetical protein
MYIYNIVELEKQKFIEYELIRIDGTPNEVEINGCFVFCNMSITINCPHQAH